MFSAAMSHAALQNGKLQVATAKGQSSLTDPKSVKEVVVSGKLFEQGDKVETNKESTVELCLSNGSTLLLNPETLIEVRTFRQVASNLIVEGAYQKLEKEPSPSVVEIQVVKGKIIGEVRKLNPQSSFTIKTPAGVARIRGTVYSVEYSENQSTRTGNMEVACVRGSVEFTVNGSNSGPAPVEPGKKVNAVAPIIPESETKQPVAAVPVKLTVAAPVASSPEVALPSTEGIVVGAEVKAVGVESGVKVVSVEEGKVVLSAPVTLTADHELVFEPPSGATTAPSSDDLLKKAKTIEDVFSKNTLVLEDSRSLKVGMKIKAPGLNQEVTVIAIDPVTHEVTLSAPVTLSAGTQITPATSDELKKSVTVEPVVSQNVVKVENSQPLKVGDTIKAPGLAEDIKVVAVNSETHEVTLSAPVTLKAGVEIAPAQDAYVPPIIATPIITFSKLEPTEISSISQNLASGTSLPPKLVQEIQKIADNTPPSPPPASKETTKGTSTESTDTKTTDTKSTDTTTETKPTDSSTTTETKTDTTTTNTNTGGGTTNTGGINNVLDNVIKTIQETVEKQNQNNPSPTGG